MITEKLSDYLGTLVYSFAGKAGGIITDTANNTSSRSYRIELESLALEFVYSKKEHESYPVSTLYCRVYLDKTNPFFFEIPDIICYLGVLDYHCYYFPYIESEKRMKACFDYITDFIEYRYDEILLLAESFDELKVKKLEEIKEVYGYNEEQVPENPEEQERFFASLDEYISAFTVSRYTTGKAYLAYLRCDYETAAQEYSKYNALLNSEKYLLEFVRDKAEPYQAVDLDCASILEAEKYKHGDFKYFILTTLASMFICAFVFLIIQLIITAYFKHTTVFCNQANPILTSLFGLLPGIFGTLIFRYKLEPLFRENRNEAKGFYELLYRRSFGSATIAFTVVAAIALLMFANFCQPSYLLYEDRMEYNSQKKPFGRYAEYPLERFDDIMYVEGVYDNHNGFQEKPYYIIKLDNYQYISFKDLHLSDNEENELIEILRHNKYSDIRHIDTIDDIR